MGQFKVRVVKNLVPEKKWSILIYSSLYVFFMLKMKIVALKKHQK